MPVIAQCSEGEWGEVERTRPLEASIHLGPRVEARGVQRVGSEQIAVWQALASTRGAEGVVGPVASDGEAPLPGGGGWGGGWSGGGPRRSEGAGGFPPDCPSGTLATGADVPRTDMTSYTDDPTGVGRDLN